MQKKFFALFFGTLAIASFVLLPKPTLAVTEADLGVEYGEATGLTKTDPRTIAANVVKALLTLLGTIAVVLVVYAGFLWMTAQGNGDQIETATSIMKAGVVGLLIILMAWSLSSFIIETLLRATTETGKIYF